MNHTVLSCLSCSPRSEIRNPTLNLLHLRDPQVAYPCSSDHSESLSHGKKFFIISGNHYFEYYHIDMEVK
jgi:hypothetical protein